MQSELCQQNLDAFDLLSAGDDECLQRVFSKTTNQSRDQIILEFTTKTLVFKANKDDDTLSVDVTSNAHTGFKATRGWSDATHSLTWRQHIGKPFGWGWVTVNQQGYCDGAMLSFDGIVPAVLFEVAASSIEVVNLTTSHPINSIEISPFPLNKRLPLYPGTFIGPQQDLVF